MRKQSPRDLPDGFGVGVLSRLSGFSPIWIRVLERRGILGPVARVDGRRQFTEENFRRLADYQEARGRK